MNITAAQRTALQNLAADPDGIGFPGTAGFPITTARALLAKGLVEIKTESTMRSVLVHGAFGRGYSTRLRATGGSVRITDAGRSALEV